MMKFQLCYALETDQAYIAPQLLSSEQPSYPWDPAGGLVLRYEYGFLPKGIVTRLIVAMHRLIAGGNLVWKTGVVLERDGSRAEIIEEYSQRRIRVRVSGPAPHGLLAIVDEQLERLHASFPGCSTIVFCPARAGSARARPNRMVLPSRTSSRWRKRASRSSVTPAARWLTPPDWCGRSSLERCGVRSMASSPASRQEAPPPLHRHRPRKCSSPTLGTTESRAIVDRLQQALGTGHSTDS